jgi:hypothetical protein
MTTDVIDHIRRTDREHHHRQCEGKHTIAEAEHRSIAGGRRRWRRGVTSVAHGRSLARHLTHPTPQGGAHGRPDGLLWSRLVECTRTVWLGAAAGLPFAW